MNSPNDDSEFFVDVPSFDWLVDVADLEILKCLERLPDPLILRADEVPVNFERVPNNALLADGLDPELLGLFVGSTVADDGALPVPSQILLFLDNIWIFAEGEERVFRREVRKTYLHELGHYLGFDEDDLLERQMD